MSLRLRYSLGEALAMAAFGLGFASAWIGATVEGFLNSVAHRVAGECPCARPKAWAATLEAKLNKGRS